VHGEQTEHARQPDSAQDSTISPSISGTGFLRKTTRLQGQGNPPFRSKVYAVLVKTCARRNTAHLHPLCAQRTSLRLSDSPDKVQHLLSPPKLRILIPCYPSYNTISPSYTPLPRVMTALALRTSLILVVEFHAVCRCTICGAQVDSEEHIPGITMMVRVDIFTKAVTSNPQTDQPKFLKQLCNSHPDLIEHTTKVNLIPPLTTNMDTRKQTRSTEIQTNPFPRPSLTHPLLPHKHTPHLVSETPTPSFSLLAGQLELGSSAPNATKFFFSGGSHNNHPAAVHARVWTPVGTGLSTPRDWAIMARPKLAGQQKRVTGHKYLRNKLSHRDVSSCRFFL